MKKVLVDLGFGVEEYIVVADHATINDIKAACLEQTGQHLFAVKYAHPETPSIINTHYNEY